MRNGRLWLAKWAAFGLLVGFVWHGQAKADNCGPLLGKGDVYWNCRAIQSGKPSDCASIHDQTTKNSCLARTRRDPSQCASIPSSDREAKALCRAQAGQ